jgi:hypothetical protein
MATRQSTRSGCWKLKGELNFLAVSLQVFKRIRLHALNEWAMTDIALDISLAQAEHGRAPIHDPNLGLVKSTEH